MCLSSASEDINTTNTPILCAVQVGQAITTPRLGTHFKVCTVAKRSTRHDRDISLSRFVCRYSTSAKSLRRPVQLARPHRDQEPSSSPVVEPRPKTMFRFRTGLSFDESGSLACCIIFILDLRESASELAFLQECLSPIRIDTASLMGVAVMGGDGGEGACLCTVQGPCPYAQLI